MTTPVQVSVHGGSDVSNAINNKNTISKVRGGFLQPLAIILIFGAIVGVSLSVSIQPEYSWLISTILMIVFVSILGLWITKNPLGVLINNRNLMSMSRLQTTLWTFLVIPGFVVLVLYRLKHSVTNPLQVTIPTQLWAAMGISLTSLVGTPLLLSPKADQSPSGLALSNTSKALGDATPEEIKQQAIGTLYSNASPSDARVSDMFQGDEVGNKGSVDLAKIQMFAFSVCLILVYAVGIWNLLVSLHGLPGEILAKTSATLPPLTQDAVYLLLISHAGYLSSKAISHTDQSDGR